MIIPMAKDDLGNVIGKEGRRIKTVLPLNVVSPFIMTTRTGSQNSFEMSFDTAACDKYVLKKRAEGLKGFGLMHCIIAAYVRTVSQLPGINRYIRGQRIWARNGIEVVMAVKKELDLNAMETMTKVTIDPSATAEDVFRIHYKEIQRNKEEDTDSSFDDTAAFLAKLPNVFLKFAIWFLKLLDYFNLLPRKLTYLSCFHGSLVITALGSLGIAPIYHHLYDFGNVPVFIAFGAKRRVYELKKDGSTELHKYVDIKINTDERICDGHYMATAFKLFSHYLKNPEELDVPPEKVVQDID